MLSDDFKKGRKEELNGLLKAGTFISVKGEDVPEGTRVFGPSIIDEIGRRRNSSLISQNYSDEDARRIATRAPTVNRHSKRLFMALAASEKNMTVHSRDFTEVYVQSTKPCMKMSLSRFLRHLLGRLE